MGATTVDRFVDRRTRTLKLAATWPWAEAITTAWQRIQDIPQAP